MTLREQRHDAQHDLTWLLGVLARAMFVSASGEGAVLAMLQQLAEGDFTLHEDARRHAVSAPACRWLPEALTAALCSAEEAAMALAAAHEHLCWQQVDTTSPQGMAAIAPVAGPRGLLRSPQGSLHLLLTAPQSRLRLATASHGLLLVLSGEAAFRDEYGALRHIPAGKAALLPPTTHVMSASRTPLLAACLRG